MTFKYKNWEGKTATRRVIPIKFWYGHTDYHKDDQWLLKATDIEKSAERDFAVKDIIRFIQEEV